ncbi:MAG: DNA polymerase III subunit beta [Candidatus Dormibacteria bacterium]
MSSPDAKINKPSSMEISIDRADLAKELSITQGVVVRKATVPILSHFLFEASGSNLLITATDLELSLRTLCPAKVKNPGHCTVPARKLYDYTRLLADGEVTIKSQENDWVQIRSGRSNTRLVGLPRKDFPSLPLYPAQTAVRLPAATFSTMIRGTLFAISREESRYMLNGALLILGPKLITMVATDGNRLAHIQAPATIPGLTSDIRVLIPKKALSEIHSLLDFSHVDIFEFAKDDSTLHFRIGSRLLSCRQLVGNFPNYESVMPRDYNRSVTLPCAEFSQALQRVSQLSDDRANTVRLDAQNNSLRLSSSNPGTGEAQEILDTDYPGDPVTIGFNARFLIEFLKAADNEKVQFYFKEPTAAGEFRPVGGEYQYRYILMPMRA